MCSRATSTAAGTPPSEARGERRQLRELVLGRWRRDVRQRARQLVDQLVEPAHARGVRRVHRVRTGLGLEEDVLDQVEPLAVVIERGDVTGEREHRIGPAEWIGRNVRQVLDLAHDVVAEVPDDPTVERRQLGEARRAVPESSASSAASAP